MMPLLASRHAAFETAGQIGIADFVESGDDLLLGDIGDFHFVRRGHAPIYVGRTSESGFSGKVWLVLTGSGALCGNS
jgi:hypothetical protein